MEVVDKTSKRIGEIGVRQFVRNEIATSLSELIGEDSDIDEILGKINKELVLHFVEIVRDESREMFDELSDLMDNKRKKGKKK